MKKSPFAAVDTTKSQPNQTVSQVNYDLNNDGVYDELDRNIVGNMESNHKKLNEMFFVGMFITNKYFFIAVIILMIAVYPISPLLSSFIFWLLPAGIFLFFVGGILYVIDYLFKGRFSRYIDTLLKILAILLVILDVYFCFKSI